MRPDFKFFDYPLPLRDDAAFGVAEICRDLPVCFPGGKPSQKQFFSGADIWKAIHFHSPLHGYGCARLRDTVELCFSAVYVGVAARFATGRHGSFSSMLSYEFFLPRRGGQPPVP